MPSHSLATSSARLQASLDRLKRGAIGPIKPNTPILPPPCRLHNHHRVVLRLLQGGGPHAFAAVGRKSRHANVLSLSPPSSCLPFLQRRPTMGENRLACHFWKDQTCERCESTAVEVKLQRHRRQWPERRRLECGLQHIITQTKTIVVAVGMVGANIRPQVCARTAARATSGLGIGNSQY